MINKKELILNILEKNPTISTARISHMIKADQYRTISLLEELLKEKKVIRIQTDKFTFWELK